MVFRLARPLLAPCRKVQRQTYQDKAFTGKCNRVLLVCEAVKDDFQAIPRPILSMNDAVPTHNAQTRELWFCAWFSPPLDERRFKYVAESLRDSDWHSRTSRVSRSLGETALRVDSECNLRTRAPTCVVKRHPSERSMKEGNHIINVLTLLQRFPLLPAVQPLNSQLKFVQPQSR